MLLRASGDHDGSKLELDTVHGDVGHDGGVTHGRLMLRFAQGCVSNDTDELSAVRAEVLELLGSEALVDCAATVAIFCAVVRIADGTGIPLEPYKEEISVELRESLELDRFRDGRDV